MLKMCHSNWFNKKLNGQQLGRGLAGTSAEVREERQSCQPDAKETGWVKNGDEVMSMWKIKKY